MQIGSQVQSTFNIANATPLFVCSLSIMDYPAGIRVTNIEGVVDAELLVVVGRNYHYFKNYDSCEKAALAFDRERMCVS